MNTLNYRRLQGFTLIEVMIVIAIIGILAATGMASYRESVLKGQRGEAKAILLSLAQAEGKFRVTNTAYADNATLDALYTVPDTETYDYNVATSTSITFTITATPQGDIGQNQDECGILTIDQNLLVTTNQTGCGDVNILYSSR